MPYMRVHFYDLTTFKMLRPIAVAARSKVWTVVARSNAGIVGSNPTQGMDVCSHLFWVCVVLGVGSGLATGWSLVQGDLPTVYRIKKLKKRPRYNNGLYSHRETDRLSDSSFNVSLLVKESGKNGGWCNYTSFIQMNIDWRLYDTRSANSMAWAQNARGRWEPFLCSKPWRVKIILENQAYLGGNYLIWNFKEIQYKGVCWLQLVQDMAQRRALVNTAKENLFRLSAISVG
jgi:hypothetical protein